ncbi:TetR/AcrR family transcriptional regulator, partial [Escherichia coli]|uniref:TetR/AcrR family transcriptional regulator n=2 Tax=Pseudomonadota TaxID=1224 RepID=UPI003F947480
MSSLLNRAPDTHASTPKRRGRPPALSLDARRRLILEAAEEVFFASGYGAASMEEIARVAGMSKKTVYGLYP